MATDSKKNRNLNAIKEVNISDDLYGNKTVSAYEIAKGYTKPIHEKSE